jgi:membrane carboxypeptidase/penicillin-binding protein
MEVFRRRRRRRFTSGSLTVPAQLGLVLVTILIVALGVTATGVAAAYLEVTQRVPAIEDITAFFPGGGGASFQLPRVVDRNGAEIQKVQNAAASEADWASLDGANGREVPGHLVGAIVAYQDPGYWDSNGYRWGDLARTIPLLRTLSGTGEFPSTITVQLVEATLLPLEAASELTFRGQFQRGLLAQRLSRGYDKTTLLNWYLNSAYFGPGIYGVDAAALAYFDRHVDELTLAESAVLGALAGGDKTVISSPAMARNARREVLERMVGAGQIEPTESMEARAQPLRLERSAYGAFADSGIAGKVIGEAWQEGGDSILRRGGLAFRTSLDLDLQQQAQCSSGSQILRLSGGGITASVSTNRGSPCLAAGLLPPLRPGRTADDELGATATVLMLDPQSGEVLAFVDGKEGLPSERIAAGKMLYPFIYLTAFSRGMSPATMVLDIPVDSELEGLTAEEAAQYLGPITMRSGLSTGSEGAAKQALDLAGPQNVQRTMRELGVIGVAPEVDLGVILDGRIEVDPLALARSYGTVANGGILMVPSRESGLATLVAVEDLFGRSIEISPKHSRVILGEGLTFLIQDILSDPTRGGELVVDPNSIGIRRPAAVVKSEAGSDGGAWGIAMSPNMLVLVWMKAGEGPAPAVLVPETGPVPVAAAMIRFASQDLAPLDWQRPSEVALVDVCVPSGLLPTTYCPEVRREVFLLGTEPTAFDSLYQPFRINRDTGNLATLQTPIEKVEERVYLVPPPAAQTWSEVVGWERPPSSYDTLTLDSSSVAGVRIDSPTPFSLLSGEVPILGKANPSGFEYYRVQVGQGLNPTRWTQIGDDRARRVASGVLETWDTQGLGGLFTIQLVVVLRDGGIRTDSIPVTLDNDPPLVRLLQPIPGAEVDADEGELIIEIDAEDPYGIGRISVYLDDRLTAILEEPPFIQAIEMPAAGSHTLGVTAEDLSGNRTQTDDYPFVVTE